MQLDNELILVVGEVATFKIRAEIVNPPETAALAATEKSGSLGEGAPAALAVSLDVGDEPVILFLSPGTLVSVSFLTTGRPTHQWRQQSCRSASCDGDDDNKRAGLWLPLLED